MRKPNNSGKMICCLWSVILLLTAFSACEKSENGDLDGMWMLTTMDSIQSNRSMQVRQRRITWSFQAKLLQFFNYNNDSWKKVIMARFNNDGTHLIIFDPFIYERMDGDIPLTADSVQYLAPHCINSVPDTFDIEKLNKNSLIISDDVLRLKFEKY